MKQKTPRRKLIEDTTELAKDIAKVRDGRICQRCHKAVSGSNCHGSHIIPVSSCGRLALMPINIKCMCSYDHLWWWHKDVKASSVWYTETFPEKDAWLEEQRIFNKSLGTISITWIEWWKDQLSLLKDADSDTIKAWEKEYIVNQIHDWVYIKE